VHQITLRPNVDQVKPTGWVVSPSGTAAAALADGTVVSPNDSTFVGNPFDYTIMLLLFSDPSSIPDSSLIVSVQPHYRCKNTSGGTLLTWFQVGPTWEHTSDVLRAPNAFVAAPGRVRTTDPRGARWTKANLTILGMDFGNYAVADSQVSTVELFVNYVNVPTATVTGPTAATSGTPLVTWLHAHDEGLTQAGFHARVFDSATYLRGDFDPATSVPYADSGGVLSSDQQWSIDVPLIAGDTYVAYVRTAVTTPIGRLWGAYDGGTAFSVTFDPPAVPTMAVTPQPDAGRVRIELHATDNLLTTQDAAFERVGAPVTWTKIITNMTTGIGSAYEAVDGVFGLHMTKTVSTADFGVSTAFGYYVNGSAEPVSFTCQMRAKPAGTTRNVHASLLAWNAGGILAVYDGATVAVGTSFVGVSVLNYTPPAAAVYVTVFITVASAASGDEFALDDACLKRGTTAPFTRGGLWTRNLLSADDSDLESTVGAWTAANANTTVARSTTVGGKVGSAALRLTAGVANAGVAARSAQVPVIAGEQYALLASFRAGAGSAFCTAAVEWYDGNGDLLSSDTLDAASATTGAWSDRSGGVHAPVGAATADVLVSWSGSLSNGSVWYVDAIELERWGDGAMPAAFSAGQDSEVSTWLVAEYSDDDGLTWIPVRDGDRIAPDVFQRAVVYDYEVPPNVLRRYRARTEASDSYIGAAPASVGSANTTEQFATVPSARWWLRSISHPERSLGFSRNLCMRTVGRKQEERAGRYDGNGAVFPVFISNAVGGHDGSLDVNVYGAEAWAAFQVLIGDAAPLVLIDPIDLDLAYIKLTGRSWTEQVSGEGPKYVVRLEFVEVGRP
jgi:hypothetical protein